MSNFTKILLVEDEAILRETMRKILADESYEVTAVGTGAQAMAAVQDQVFDIVLLDVKLPDANGVDILEKIKQIHPHTEAVVMTGFEMEDTIRKAFALGALTCLSKPFEVQMLLDICANVRHSHGN